MASVRIGSAFGIPVELRPSFLLVLPLLAYLIGTQVGEIVTVLNGLLGTGIDPTPLTAGAAPWVLGVVAALGLFGGVVLHEFGHSLVARHYGLHIESISLWFLGGIAKFTEFPDDWRKEFTIAIAGPVVSVVLGVLCYAVFVWLPGGYPAVRFVVGYLAVLNVALAAFNLLPGFPMDGGRVLRALLSRTRSPLQATRIAAQVGKGFAVLLGIVGILVFNVFWLAIAFFIYMGATAESRQATLEAAFEGITVGDIMTGVDDLQTVEPTTDIATLIDRMITERHTGYPVLEDGALAGIVTLQDAQSVPLERRDSVTVGDVMSTDLKTVHPNAGAMDAISTIQREDVGRLLVTRDGDLVGLISRTDLMTVFEVIRSSGSEVAAERAVGG